MKGWKKVSEAAQYYGVSTKTMRSLLKDGFPHSRLPTGTILIELEAGDNWLRAFNVDRKHQEMVDDLVRGINQ